MILGFMLMDLGTLSGVLYYSMLMAVVKMLSVGFVLAFGLSQENSVADDTSLSS